jgi:hypothetical protein
LVGGWELQIFLSLYTFAPRFGHSGQTPNSDRVVESLDISKYIGLVG